MQRIIQSILALAAVALIAADPAERTKPPPPIDRADVAALKQIGIIVGMPADGLLSIKRRGGPSTLPLSGTILLKRLQHVGYFELPWVADDDVLECTENWPDLKLLDVSCGKISDAGLGHLPRLWNLKVLKLGSTSVTNAGMHRIGAIKSLCELDLKRTKITDDGLESLASLAKLEKLCLRSTRVSDAGLEPLAHCSSLKRLDLSSTGVTDKGMATIARLANLEFLSMEETDLTDAGVAKLAPLKKLKHLELAGTLATTGVRRSFSPDQNVEIAGLRTAADLGRVDDPADVAAIRAAGVYVETNKLRNITKIDATRDNQPGEWLSRLTNLHELAELDLPQCTSDSNLIAACKARTLRTLTADHASISNYGLKDIGNLTELRKLSLGGCHRLTDLAARRLSALTNLESLDLDFASISDSGASELASLRKLERLNLEQTPISDKTIQRISSLPQLRSLILDSTRVTDDCVVDLQRMTQLRVLSVQRTRISQSGAARLRNALPGAIVDIDLR